MKSWDCFDTLIARRFYFPDSIFHEVGMRLKIDNFPQLRKQAEKKSNKTYDDIYKNLPNIDPQIEIQVELEHCFPIMENILQVQDGDMIISDFYNPNLVFSLLKKNGLNKNVQVIVTPNGKSSGKIWSTLPKIDSHTGDNPKSDIKMAHKNGINASIYNGYKFNDIESIVSQVDFELACWMRYTRLQCPYFDSLRKNLWTDQADFNLPILALATKELPARDIAFNYRDCVYWHPLYEEMTGKTATRFDSSRICLKDPSNFYRDYVINTTQNKFIVDLQGTGKSIEKFFGYRPENIFFITGEGKNNILIPGKSDAIEKHNCADFGTLIGWEKDGPIRKECEHSKITTDTQAEAMKIGTMTSKWFKIKQNKGLLSILLDKICENYTTKNVFHQVKHSKKIKKSTRSYD